MMAPNLREKIGLRPLIAGLILSVLATQALAEDKLPETHIPSRRAQNGFIVADPSRHADADGNETWSYYTEGQIIPFWYVRSKSLDSVIVVGSNITSLSDVNSRKARLEIDGCYKRRWIDVEDGPVWKGLGSEFCRKPAESMKLVVLTASANCDTGVFINLHGMKFRFTGRSDRRRNFWIIQDVETGEMLNPRSDDDWIFQMVSVEQYKAMCPAAMMGFEEDGPTGNDGIVSSRLPQ